jgi:hypothetical protein
MDIVGYIHVCQKGEWKKSFIILLNALHASKLYDAAKVIRLGIVNDEGNVIDDPILNDNKFQIVYVGKSEEYERPTLLEMRKASESEVCNYFYLHTKGIRHFGTFREQFVLDWINLMLFWNVEKWHLAVQKLESYDTYGCNDVGHHYSGNFWWAKSDHIRNLPQSIGPGYCDPEDWIQVIRKNKFTVFNSGLQGMKHYSDPFPREKYCFF